MPKTPSPSTSLSLHFLRLTLKQGTVRALRDSKGGTKG
jgi:hypothetical protein